MSARAEHPGSALKQSHRITVLPATNLGWWTVGLASAFLPLVFAAPVVPRAAALGFVCGLGGGVAALTAIIREQERALTVYTALLPLVISVAFGLSQLIH